MNRDIECAPCGQAVSEEAAAACRQRPQCPARAEARERENMRFYARLRDAQSADEVRDALRGTAVRDTAS